MEILKSPSEQGPLTELLEDLTVTEILILGGSRIWIERNGKLCAWHSSFSGSLEFHRFVNQCLDEAGLVVDLKRPFGDGVWRDFRLHVTLSPLSEETCLSLRRQQREGWSFAALLENGWASSRWVNTLSKWFQEGQSLIVYGDTGSGKTATAEALLKALPENCRVVLLEDTREIKPPNDASTRLVTRKPQGDLKEINFTELLRQSLRMRPDRLVMGEIRGSEAKDFLMVLASGHCGGLATLHADSATKALLRLEMLVQLGAPQWDLRSVRLLIAHSIHYLIKVGRDDKGVRRLLALDKISSLEPTGFLLDSVDLEE